MIARFTVKLLVFLFICSPAFAQQIPLIPLPNQFSKGTGTFILSSATPVIADGASQKTANYFQKELLRNSGIAVSIPAQSKNPSVILKMDGKKNPNIDTYAITMAPAAITVSASSEEGLFNGVTSLLQMIRKTPVRMGSVSLGCWNIQDAPRYAWRGFMLDESRHFFGKEKVKSILDWMAFYKMNRFHWHLTDQPGWRIEIKQYPKLALVGGIGNHTSKYESAKYYTQDDISEIVSYAAERHIEIIPELDMPGHATAANMAYPEFSGGGNEAHPEFTFNPGKNEVYSYLTNILKEIDALFPSQMIHIGADEVAFGTDKWKTNPDVTSLMQNNKLADLKAVEFYFNRRIGDSILKMNNTLLAWDEAVDAGLPVDKTTIVWWRHDKPEGLKAALDKGYKVVLSPRLPMYFDFVQDSIHQFGRRWQGSFNTLANVYAFSQDQIPATAGKPKQVIGIQANLWTETVGTEARLDFLLFPRITALAEAAWTDTDKKNYQDFSGRVKSDLELFRKAGIYYFDAYSVRNHSEPPAPDKE